MSSVNAYFIVKWYNLIKNDIKNKDSPNSIFIKKYPTYQR